MKILIILLSTLCCARAMTETELRPEVNKYLREFNADGLLNQRQKRQSASPIIYRYYVTQCDYNMTEETSPSIEIYANSFHVTGGDAPVIKAARLIHRMVRFMSRELFVRLAENSAVGMYDYTSLPSQALPELAVIPTECYATCEQVPVRVNETYSETYDCSQWCTSSLYPYYNKFPINYLWAYGNLSRTFVVTNNVMCEGFNPSGGRENYLVREFALTIMTRALSEEQQAEIDEAYNVAASQIWVSNPPINVYDYFMKGALIWFNGVASDDLSGMNCKNSNIPPIEGLPDCSTGYHMRKYLKLKDPQLYNILLHVFNNNRAYLQSYTEVCDW